MNQTFTPHDATRVLAEAAAYEEALQQRTEGLTWMVWGLVTPAVFLTYAAAGTFGVRGAWWGILWVPWVAAANLVVWMLWRSANLSAPALEDPAPTRSHLLRILVMSAAIAIVFRLWKPDTVVGPLLLIGAFWVALGMLDPFRMSLYGRRLAVVLGTIGIGGGAVLGVAPLGGGASLLVALLLSGVVPLLGGLLQTLRG